MSRTLLVPVLWVLLSLFGCVKIKHDMTIQPVTVTVEIRVKIDRELEDFFGDIDKVEPKKEADSEKKEKENEK